MNIEAWHWPKSQALTEVYIHQYDQVQSLYEYDPWQEKSWAQRASWLDQAQRPQASRQKLAKVLTDYNMRIGAPEQAIHAAKALADEQALTIVGGQQAGLFTGPMLVIWKAITVIQKAKQAEALLKRPVVPVFWIAGEDHDWEEVNHIFLSSPNLQLAKYRLADAVGAGKSSVSQVSVSVNAWEEALKELNSSLIDTEFKAELLEVLTVHARQSNSLSDYFARIVSWLFGHHGLVLIDSADPSVRALEGEMFAKLIEQHRLVNDAFLEASQAIEAMGYQPQVNVSQGQIHLFAIIDGERRLLFEYESSEHAGTYTDKFGMIYTKDQLLDWAGQSPERLSNNALTRPIMQEYLLPVLGTVLGPAEIAYWGLLKQAFHGLQMKMPILIPRYEYTLIEPTIHKYMQKYGFAFQDVVYRFQTRKQEWLDQRDTFKFDEQFDELKQRFMDMYDPLLDTVYSIHNGMRSIGETNKRKITEQLDYMRRRAIDAYNAQFETALRQMDQIELSLLPLGKPQERLYNIFEYLNKYGLDWLDKLVMTTPADEKRHNVVYF